MIRNVLRLIVIILVIFAVIKPVYAQGAIPRDMYYKARVTAIIEEGAKTINDVTVPYQVVEVQILDGNLKNRTLTIDHGMVFSIDKSKFVQVEDAVVLVQTIGPEGTPVYQIMDAYRLDRLIPFLVAFVIAVIALSGWHGVGSLAGMMISVAVIAKYIVPQILAGADPLLVSIVGCTFIMITTIYLAHGFSKQTTVALVSTAATLIGIGLLSVFITEVTKLTGLGSDDAYSLKMGPTASINFRGLLLGGILIGALGVLDDVTTGLSASVFELSRANAKLSFGELTRAGLRVGREHISSLVNTLVLAYAGASLPIFIILITNPNGYPFWTILNSETIVEEIVRTLTGSLGLILAVPLTTILAAWQAVPRRHLAHKSQL